MSAELAHQFDHKRRTRVRTLTGRARLVAGLGPVTVLAGIVWAVAQPHRITLLHPHGQGFWWLLSEPPLFVVLAGALFHLLVAGALIDDMRQYEDEDR